MKFYQFARSFFRKKLQIRRHFTTKCTQTSTRGAKLPPDATFSESLKKGLDKVVSRGEKNFSVHRKYMNFFQYRKTALDECLYKLSAGRSMVEMLGVLAIIGVLSVGAISGYSAAMTKYKLNKQTEQIGSILDYVYIHIEELNRDRNNMSYHMLPLLIKLGIIPQEMIHKNDSSYIYDPFNNKILLYFGQESGGNYFGASIYFSNYDKNSCRNLFNIAKYRSDFITYAFIQKATEDSSAIQSTWLRGDSVCVSKNNCLKDIAIKQIDEICTMCNDALSGTCRVIYLWNSKKTN